MKLIVGLGNPTEQYAHTLHNAGFDTIDLIAPEAHATYWKTKGGALVAEGRLCGEEVILAKPQSYMNTSGGPVKELLKIYKLTPSDLIVIHDDLDITPGHVRVKHGGGHAGHNGLRSICDKLQTRDWSRIRVGIGRPPGRMPVADYVLSRPKGEVADAIQAGIATAHEAIQTLMRDGLEKAQMRYNEKN